MTIEAQDKRQALLEAVKAGDAGLVASILKENPAAAAARDPQMNVSALMAAVYRGRMDIATLLADAKGEVDLVEAVALGRLDVVKKALDENAARANEFSADGFPLIGLAANFGHRPIVELLLARGADVNAISKNPMKYTALTGAVAQNRLEMIALLLQHGAKADYVYATGYTPLHEAANKGSIEVAKLLLEHGADPGAATQDGKTPIDVAIEKNHSELAGLLRAHRRT